MEALQNGQTTSEGGIEGQSAVAASHAMIEKILSEEPRWQGKILKGCSVLLDCSLLLSHNLFC